MYFSTLVAADPLLLLSFAVLCLLLLLLFLLLLRLYPQLCVREVVLRTHVVALVDLRQQLRQGVYVGDGAPQGGDLGVLLLVDLVQLVVWHALLETVVGHVDLVHPLPLPVVGGLAAVFAERGRPLTLLAALGKVLVPLGLDALQDGPGPQLLALAGEALQLLLAHV